MKKRSIPLSLLLSAITLGIYSLVWFYKISEEIIDEIKYSDIDSPGLNLLYLIITCGLYYNWWNYKISTYLNTLERKKGIEPDFWAPIFSMYFGPILHQVRMNRIVSASK